METTSPEVVENLLKRFLGAKLVAIRALDSGYLFLEFDSGVCIRVPKDTNIEFGHIIKAKAAEADQADKPVQ